MQRQAQVCGQEASATTTDRTLRRSSEQLRKTRSLQETTRPLQRSAHTAITSLSPLGQPIQLNRLGRIKTGPSITTIPFRVKSKHLDPRILRSSSNQRKATRLPSLLFKKTHQSWSMTNLRELSSCDPERKVAPLTTSMRPRL